MASPSTQGGSGNGWDPTVYTPASQTAGITGQYGVQQAAQQAQASEYGSTEQAKTAAAALAEKGGEFNQLYGLLSGNIAGQGSSSGGLGGTATSAQPGVTTGGVYTPQQVQAQIAQSNAQGIQGAQTQQVNEANQMAGQGFGSRSPALQAMQQNAMSQALASNAANATQLNTTAAQQNAQQNLASQTQAQTGWYQAQQQDIARRQVNQQYASSLAAALAGAV